jgi:osmotically-inducible protein OsmY
MALLPYAPCIAAGSARLARSPFRHQGSASTHPETEEPTMMSTDGQVRDDVRAALAADQRLPYADEIAVDVYDSVVTLRGTVGSFAQQRAAVADARGTDGVIGAYDALEVRLLNDDRRKDAEIRGAALQRLNWDPEIPGFALDVKVEDGWLTLKGDVDFQFQSDDAFDDVIRLRGVTGVTNEIRVVQTR